MNNRHALRGSLPVIGIGIGLAPVAAFAQAEGDAA